MKTEVNPSLSITTNVLLLRSLQVTGRLPQIAVDSEPVLQNVRDSLEYL